MEIQIFVDEKQVIKFAWPKMWNERSRVTNGKISGLFVLKLSHNAKNALQDKNC